jgi:HK97 family phage prohead protease
MDKLKGYLKEKEGEITGIASTETVDRDGEVIRANGWDLLNFKENPVLMLMHNYQEFPIGKITDIAVEGKKLTFKAIFSQKTQKAIEAYELVKEGILSAFSVGFIAREFDPKDQNIITKAELLEISLVPVPANPEAIVMAKGFKENEIAKFIVKNFDLEEKKEEEKEEEESKKEPEEIQDNASVVEEPDKDGEESVKALDIDLKVIQKATGLLQEVCRELKKKGGATK